MKGTKAEVEKKALELWGPEFWSSLQRRGAFIAQCKIVLLEVPSNKEEQRSLLESVPLYRTNSFEYVRLQDVPEDKRASLEEFLRGQQCPVVDGAGDVCYALDFYAWYGSLKP
jgi:hypothetical protein